MELIGILIVAVAAPYLVYELLREVPADHRAWEVAEFVLVAACAAVLVGWAQR